MFIGHFGVGFGAKKIATRPSLGTLLMASQFVDLLWPIFLLLNLEQVQIDPGNTAFTPLNFINYPLSHSLLGVLVWAFLFGIVYYFYRKDKKNAIILGALVISHWILDLLTHRPDLPIIPGTGVKVGLGLWNSVALTIIVESLIYILGIYLYFKATKAKNKTGSYSLWGLVIFLAIVYISNIFGPPPPGAEPIAYVGLSQWLIIFWAYWIDRNRRIEK